MKETIDDKIKQLWQQAKKTGKSSDSIKVTLTSGNETALSRVIKTKEQADLFMKILKSL